MILLNNILQLPNPKNVKLRFNLRFGTNRPAIDYFTDNTPASFKHMLDGQYWNYSKKGNFSVGNISLGFVPVPTKQDCWLLFHIGEVTKDLNVHNGVGYQFKDLTNYDQYIGRIIVRFKNSSQNLIRRGDTTLPLCELEEILPQVYNNDIFPGYDKVNISWQSLSNAINKTSWRTALGNQKGVYLLVDSNTGKKYVGSAYGQDMLLGRWENYIKTCHGGNIKLKKLLKANQDYVKDYFYFSILETFNQNTNDQIIIERENHWKEVLRTRMFGYNDN
ncbi:MAG: GIY-YIG nuclease family protein [Prevotella sp.]|nr:GIY-YIG nuclease family protein [Prevotella sp.]